MAKQPALGKGLGALISARPGVLTTPQPGERVQAVPLDLIVPSPLQPRTDFRAEQLTELVESIRERGIIQPLIVRLVDGKYELIAGERRWRAATQAQLKEAPVIVRAANDREVLELALVENLQREDLNPIEEAHAYARLSGEFSMTQEEIARKVGKNRATVANAMRLLDLEESIQTFVRKGQLSVGHAKALLAVKNLRDQKQLAEQVIRQGAPVRATEQLVAKFLQQNGSEKGSEKSSKPGSPRAGGPSSPVIQRVENLLQQRLGTRVALKHGDKTGSILIEYYGNDDLNRILPLLGIESLE